MDSPLAVVVGGGFAGLAAATALSEQGVCVHLFEARPTLGGRANAFRDPSTGERIDNGQHVLAGCYTETLAFLKRIGSSALLHRPSALRVPMIDDRGWRTELALPALPAPFDVLAGVLAWDTLTTADRWSMLKIRRALRDPRSADSGETVRHWLVRHGQTRRLCALFWEPLALATLNQSIDQAAADMFVAVTSRMFGPEPDAASILVPALPLDELYTLPARQFLEMRGSSVQTRARAEITFDGDRVLGVDARGTFTRALTVICAVPWFALRDTMATVPPALAHAVHNATRLASCPIVTVNLWFDRFHLDDPMLGLPGRTFQWVFDRRRFVRTPQSHLSLVSSGAEAICAMANDDVIRVAIEEVRSALPAAVSAHVRHASVVRERRATFSLAPGAPRRPHTTTPVEGLFLAGDWIDTGLPATIESAVMSGHRAASAAVRRLRTLPSTPSHV